MTNQEDAPLPVSSHSEANRAMVIRNRRLMRRACARDYIRNRRLMRRACARSYSSDDAHPLPDPEPVLEQSGFAPLPDTPAEQPPTRYWTGFAHGFCVALGGVLVITGVLLWKGMP